MAQQLRGKKIAVLATDGFEQIELTEPVKALKSAGAEVQVVAPRAGTIQGFKHHDKADKIPVDAALDSVDASDYAGLVLPGGVINPDALRLEPRAIAFIRAFVQAHKPIAAICHGVQILTAAGVVEGKGCTAYPAVGPEVRRAGGRWVEVAVDKAHADGNLVTAPAWPAHPEWLAKFLHVLGTRIEP